MSGNHCLACTCFDCLNGAPLVVDSKAEQAVYARMFGIRPEEALAKERAWQTGRKRVCASMEGGP